MKRFLNFTPSHVSSAWQHLPLSLVKADKVGDLNVQRRKKRNYSPTNVYEGESDAEIEKLEKIEECEYALLFEKINEDKKKFLSVYKKLSKCFAVLLDIEFNFPYESNYNIIHLQKMITERIDVENEMMDIYNEVEKYHYKDKAFVKQFKYPFDLFREIRDNLTNETSEKERKRQLYNTRDSILEKEKGQTETNCIFISNFQDFLTMNLFND